MNLKLKLTRLNYKYIIFLSLANQDIRMTQIEDYIEDRVKDYNIYQRTSTKNKKRISDWKVDEKQDLLIITVESENSLKIPVRGIKYFTQILIEHIKKEDKLLLDEILRKNAFFRTVDIEFQEKNTIKNDIEVKENIVEKTKIVKEADNMLYLKQVCKNQINTLMDFLISSEISEENKEKIKSIDKILKCSKTNE